MCRILTPPTVTALTDLKTSEKCKFCLRNHTRIVVEMRVPNKLMLDALDRREEEVNWGIQHLRLGCHQFNRLQSGQVLIPTAFRITGFLSTFAGECSFFSFVVEWNWPAGYTVFAKRYIQCPMLRIDLSDCYGPVWYSWPKARMGLVVRMHDSGRFWPEIWAGHEL